MEIKTASVLPIADSEERERLADWLLVAGQHRDSGPLDLSNFRSILRHLGGESDTVEVLRFGHFAVGWVEEILVHPSRRSEVESIKDKLDTYPIFDDDDHSECEYEWAVQSWEAYGHVDLAHELDKAFKLQDRTECWIRSLPFEVTFDWQSRGASEAYEFTSDTECSFDFEWVRKAPRRFLAKLLREARREVKANG